MASAGYTNHAGSIIFHTVAFPLVVYDISLYHTTVFLLHFYTSHLKLDCTIIVLHHLIKNMHHILLQLLIQNFHLHPCYYSRAAFFEKPAVISDGWAHTSDTMTTLRH